MPDPDLVATLSQLLTALPDVSEVRTENHGTFLINKKVFAFTRSGGGGGVALKLPRERIAELLHKEEFSTFTMGTRAMKEWVLLTHERPSSYKKNLPLFKEAIAFVSSGKQVGKSATKPASKSAKRSGS